MEKTVKISNLGLLCRCEMQGIILQAYIHFQGGFMRFMMLMIPQGYESAKPGTMPDASAVAAMMKYNEELKKAGVLVSLEGLHPPSMGVRVRFSNGKATATPGPFPDIQEVLGGFWIINVKSMDDAVSWATKCPASNNETIEVRQIQEFEDFPKDVQKAAAGFKDMISK
jgi:hypothetical protein